MPLNLGRHWMSPLIKDNEMIKEDLKYEALVVRVGCIEKLKVKLRQGLVGGFNGFMAQQHSLAPRKEQNNQQ